MKTKAITHPPRQTLVIIREDYLAICDGDHCAAAIMNIFEYWNDHKEANREQVAIENKIAAEGGAQLVNDDLWIYKSIPELKTELLGLFGDTKISNALDLIKSKGLLDSRNNPKYGWDRTLQYQLNVKVTQALILRHGTSRKNKASKGAKLTDGSLRIKAAIPKTTTETTSKNDTRKRDIVFDAIGYKIFELTSLEGISGSRIGKLAGIARKITLTRKPEATVEEIVDLITRFAATQPKKQFIQGNDSFELNFARFVEVQPANPPPVAAPPPPAEAAPTLTPEQVAERERQAAELWAEITEAIVEKAVA